MFIDFYLFINISPHIRMASSGTLNECWRLCIEDATRSIWRHKLVVQTQSTGVFLNVQIGSFFFDVKLPQYSDQQPNQRETQGMERNTQEETQKAVWKGEP